MTVKLALLAWLMAVRRKVSRMTTTGAGIAGPAGAAEMVAPPVAAVEVDDLDFALLGALASDARRSQRALARVVGISPPAIAGRLARLERAGVIRGYRADINWAALGCPVVVYLAVSSVPGQGLGPVIRAISELPEIQEMSVVTGGPDLLVRQRVSGHAHLRSLLLDTIFKIPGVQRTEVFLSLGEVESANFATRMLARLARLARPGGQHGRDHGGEDLIMTGRR
jgi:Lrp/AsnC family transcriptional regulator, leucine-responsive regulatory protein